MYVQYPLKVAVIDDNDDILDLLEDFVEDQPDFHIVKFVDPFKALEAMKMDTFPIAVIDIGLIGMSGDDLILEINKLQKGTQTMVITGGTHISVLSRCYRLLSRDYLVKPFPKQTFVDALKDCKKHIEHWNKILTKLAKTA